MLRCAARDCGGTKMCEARCSSTRNETSALGRAWSVRGRGMTKSKIRAGEQHDHNPDASADSFGRSPVFEGSVTGGATLDRGQVRGPTGQRFERNMGGYALADAAGRGSDKIDHAAADVGRDR